MAMRLRFDDNVVDSDQGGAAARVHLDADPPGAGAPAPAPLVEPVLAYLDHGPACSRR